MQKLKCLLTGCLLALAVSFGFSAALSTPSFATSVYTFTYTGASYGNDGLEFTLNGSFSIPVSDFSGDPASLPNTDIVALSFLGVSLPTYYNTNTGSASFATPDIVADTVLFTYLSSIPQVSEGTGNLAQNPGGNVLFIGCCNTGFSFTGINGDAEVEVPGTWVTTTADFVATTPLPAALPLFASGLGLLGWGMRRRKQKQLAAA